MLSKMMTSTKGEVQKCAMVGLSMFPDGEGLRKYLEQQDSKTMRREAAPVFHILCRVMLRRVCIVAGLHRNVWADRVLRHVRPPSPPTLPSARVHVAWEHLTFELVRGRLK